MKYDEETYLNMRGSNNVIEEDLYKVLDVERQAEAADVKKAYKKLALRWHPDRNRNCESCEEKFREVAKAYETLGDPEKRRVYDATMTSFEDIPSQFSVQLTLNNYDVRARRAQTPASPAEGVFSFKAAALKADARVSAKNSSKPCYKVFKPLEIQS